MNAEFISGIIKQDIPELKTIQGTMNKLISETRER
jgi:hypothetical protein